MNSTLTVMFTVVVDPVVVCRPLTEACSEQTRRDANMLMYWDELMGIDGRFKKEGGGPVKGWVVQRRGPDPLPLAISRHVRGRLEWRTVLLF